MPAETSASATHPSAEELAEFARGALGRKDAEALEEHLRGCFGCREIVSDLRGEADDDDAELGAAWEAMRPRLGPQLPSWRAGPLPHRLLRVAAALAVFVAGALAGIFLGPGSETKELSERVARLELELEALRTPHTLVVEIDLFPRGALRGAEPEPTLTIPAAARLVLLNLQLAEAEGRARLEIYDDARRRVATVEEIEPDELGKVTVALPRGLLSAGTYLLRLSAPKAGGGAGGGEPAIEYVVEVEDGGPGG